MSDVNPVYTSSRRAFVPPAQPEPESLHAAREESARLGNEMLGINHQLGANDATRPDGTRMTPAEYDDWRRRAKAAIRFKQDRKNFLDLWIRERAEAARDARLGVPGLTAGLSATAAARELAKRVGRLEAVFVAARNFGDDPSAEHLRELKRCIADALAECERGEARP